MSVRALLMVLTVDKLMDCIQDSSRLLCLLYGVPAEGLNHRGAFFCCSKTRISHANFLQNSLEQPSPFSNQKLQLPKYSFDNTNTLPKYSLLEKTLTKDLKQYAIAP